MQQLISNSRALLRRRTFTVPLLIALALSFGLRITTVSLHIDDFARDIYLSGYYLAAGRFGGSLFMNLLQIPQLYPFAEKLLGVLFLGAAAVILCEVFRRASFDRLPPPFLPDICMPVLFFPSAA